MNYIEALTKRYSVKKFDSEKKIPENVLENILQAGKLSASSLGLQPYTIYVVQNQEVLTKLQAGFHNPSQVSTCSHLIVITTKKEIDNQYINDYFKTIGETRNIEASSLEPFRKSIDYYLDKHDDQSIIHWNEKQSYIVLGTLLFAATLENVDTCPMEGFIPDKIEEILNINTEKEKVTVTLALGYRAKDDVFQTFKKVRKPDDKPFKTI